jgi:putative transposase
MERYRIHAEAAVYYLTYSVVEWLPVFVSGATCKLVTDSLTFCHREKLLLHNGSAAGKGRNFP